MNKILYEILSISFIFIWFVFFLWISKINDPVTGMRNLGYTKCEALYAKLYCYCYILSYNYLSYFPKNIVIIIISKRLPVLLFIVRVCRSFVPLYSLVIPVLVRSSVDLWQPEQITVSFLGSRRCSSHLVAAVRKWMTEQSLRERAGWEKGGGEVNSGGGGGE